MRSALLDPTAGARARRIRAHPDSPERISDPMDPRYGGTTDSGPAAGTRIVDPTDPHCGDGTH